MVATRPDNDEVEFRFVLRPRFGGHWRETLRIFALIATVTMAVAFGFAALGFWPILPFAGLELAALGGGLYASGRRALDVEVVTVGAYWVRIEKGRGRPQQSWCFERLFSEVRLAGPEYRLHPRRLAIRCRDAQVELGSFLVEEERAALARELRRCIGPVAGDGERPVA